MKPIEVNQVAAGQPVRSRVENASSGRPERAAPVHPASTGDPAMVARSQALEAGATPPVDDERVHEIKSAIREGRYPLIPTKVADAIVAAGFLLTDSSRED